MIEFYKNTKYKVKTPTGFKNFSGIRRTTKPEKVEIIFEDDTKLECSLDHRFVVDGVEILARDVKIAQRLSPTKIVANTTIKNNSKFLYDLVEVGDDSLYIADDIISHNCDFSTSGNTVVSPEHISYYSQTYAQEPVQRRGFDGNLWVWEIPDYTKSYIVCADVARGDGSDYSAFHVLDVESCRQIAEYKGQIGTKDFGNMLVAIATEYNDALLVVENANVGWAALQQILDRGYKNLYYTYKDDVLDSDKFLTKGYDLGSKANMVAGFTMSPKIRPLIVSKMELYIRERSCVIRSKRLLEELFVFVWKNSRPEAAIGYNDDLIMSFCSGLWVRDTALRLRQAGIEINKIAINHIKSTNTLYKASENKTSWKMPTVQGNTDDITWLL